MKDPGAERIGHRASERAVRQTRAHHGRGHQGLRRARLSYRDRGRDRQGRRCGRRHYLFVFQGKRRPLAAALRREDDRAPGRGALGALARKIRARQAAALHPASPRAGRAQSRSGLGPDRRIAAERPVHQGGRSGQAGGICRSDCGGRPRRSGERRAVERHLAGYGETGRLRRSRRAGAGMAPLRPADEPEEDRGGSRGVDGAGPQGPKRRKVLKILVTVKRVEDYESKIKVKPDNTWIVTEGVNYRANPFDEIAVEEALRVRDTNMPSEVVAVSIGKGAPTAAIRSALALTRATRDLLET